MSAALRMTIAIAALAVIAHLSPVSAQEIAIVTKRVIYPGETISGEALREVRLKTGRIVPPAMVVNAATIEGRVAKRTLLPGRYIPMASIRDAYLLNQGAPVEIVFVAGGLVITAQGVVIEPGSEGDLVKVRNADSGKVLTGTVMSDGTVRIGAS